MICYGSYALKKWFPDYPKVIKDIDIVTLDEADLDNNKDFLNDLKHLGLPIEINQGKFFDSVLHLTENNFLNPDGLLTVKASHAMYDWHWNKTILDIIYLKTKGAKIDTEACMELRKGWKKLYAGWREPMDFNLSPAEFFNSNVKRIYNHDALHEVFKHYDNPAYTLILESPDKVKVSKSKFEKLNLEQQLSTALEEVCVLACERYYKVSSPAESYLLALRDFTTRMTNGWYNLFLIDNITFFYTYKNKNTFDKITYIKEQICEKIYEEEKCQINH